MSIEVPWFCACRFPCTFGVTWLAALKASASVKHVVLDIVGPPSFTGWAQLCLLSSLAVMSFFLLVIFAVRAVLAVESHCAHSGCGFRIFCYIVVVGLIPFRDARRPMLCSGRAGVSFFSEAVAVPMVIILSVFRCRILKVAVSGFLWASS